MIIVSGLPRSGTSMMMAMLEAGGLECVDDGFADIGSYEHSRALMGSWSTEDLQEWQGKAVKILDVLPSLPHHQCKVVIVMRRDLDRIVASGKAVGLRYTYERRQQQLYEIRLWCASEPHMEVWYEDVLNFPVQECCRIAQVVDVDVDAMAVVPRRNNVRDTLVPSNHAR